MSTSTSTFDGTGVWVAVLDSGFYPNWRDYLDESKVLTNLGRAFVAANANENENMWDVGSDPHGMAVSGTIIGHTFRDDTNEGGWVKASRPVPPERTTCRESLPTPRSSPFACASRSAASAARSTPGWTTSRA